jgi:hypothetical protein
MLILVPSGSFVGSSRGCGKRKPEANRWQPDVENAHYSHAAHGRCVAAVRYLQSAGTLWVELGNGWPVGTSWSLRKSGGNGHSKAKVNLP